MKKWHMEGIVRSGEYTGKLIIPDQREPVGPQFQKLEEPRKDSLVTRVLRYGVSLFLRYF